MDRNDDDRRPRSDRYPKLPQIYPACVHRPRSSSDRPSSVSSDHRRRRRAARRRICYWRTSCSSRGDRGRCPPAWSSPCAACAAPCPSDREYRSLAAERREGEREREVLREVPRNLRKTSRKPDLHLCYIRDQRYPRWRRDNQSPAHRLNRELDPFNRAWNHSRMRCYLYVTIDNVRGILYIYFLSRMLQDTLPKALYSRIS